MADLPPYTTPRWVKLAGIIVLILVLVFGVLQLTGIAGEHGPGRHMPSGDAGAAPRSTLSVEYTSFAGGADNLLPPVVYAPRQL